MSRLRNIPQSGPEAVSGRIATLERQMRSLRGQRVRGPQSAWTHGTNEVIWPGSSGTWLTMDATILVPERGGLVLVSWNAELKQPVAAGVNVELRSDVTFPGRGGASIPLEFGLSVPTSYSVRTAPAISSDPGVSPGLTVEVEPGTRTLSIALWSTQDIYIQRRNLWITVV